MDEWVGGCVIRDGGKSGVKERLQLFKTFNLLIPLPEWTHVNFDQQITLRQVYINVNRNNRLHLVLNAICNRFFLPKWQNYSSLAKYEFNTI
jgi:hypothetical protein